MNNNGKKEVTICSVQVEPVMFSKSGCLDKIRIWTQTAAKVHNANLVVFPEAFVPGYPRGLSFGFQVGTRTEEGRKTWQLFYDNSFDINSEDGTILCSIAKENGVDMVVGVVEKEKSTTTLYCSLVYISAEGKILGVHRKLKPTGSERLIWGQGNGSTLLAPETVHCGRVGGLICWENYMPLARTFIYSKNPNVYVAPTADARPNWTFLMQTIACENRCFVIGCNQYQSIDFYRKVLKENLLSEDDRNDIEFFIKKNKIDIEKDCLCKGGSVIVDPMGKILAGPLNGCEGILSAKVDLNDIKKAKMDFDAVGHYSSNEIFKLEVDQNPKTLVNSKL